MKRTFQVALWIVGVAACQPDPTQPAAVTGGAVADDPPTQAALGRVAPDFALPDLDGRMVRLADYRGKVVVLEWFNPECPYVRASHTKGSLKDLAKRYSDQGVAWFAINSAARGKEGAGTSATAAGKQPPSSRRRRHQNRRRPRSKSRKGTAKARQIPPTAPIPPRIGARR